jgi:cytochrome b
MNTYARFMQFVPTPSKVKAYLRGEWHGVGHNPLGAFSVFGLLGLLAFQVTSGLLSQPLFFTYALKKTILSSPW